MNILRTKNYVLLLGCAALLLLPLTPSSAVVLTYTATTPLTAAPSGNDFTLPAFDSNAGTLDTVAFIYDIPISGSASVSYSGSRANPFGGDVIVSNTFSNGPEGFVDSEEITAMASVAGTAAPDSTRTYSGTGDAYDSTPISSDDFTYWEEAGGGTLNFTLNAGAPSASGGGEYHGLTFSDATASESGTFSVEYDYTTSVPSVPEPSQYGLFIALAVAGLVVVRRFTRQGA